MQLSYKDIHHNFTLNGVTVSFNDLDEVSYNLIKEGEPYEQVIGDFLLHWIDKNDSIEVNTSGSTGAPKLIRLGKQQMINSALATGTFFNLNPNDSALLCLPVNYIAGKMMLVRSMMLGLQLETVEPLLSPLIDSAKNYTFCAMVPMQLENSLAQIKNIRTLIIGGVALSNALKEKVQTLETEVYETFGMTETITHIAVKRINPNKNDSLSSVENYFETLPNVTVQKDDRDCLVINAPKINDQVIYTNDIVQLLSGSTFVWLGRYDTIINSGGIKLIPEQIEEKLAPYITHRFFVTGMADVTLGQKLVLIVEGKLNKENLFKQLNSDSSLNKYEIPKEIIHIDDFIETKTGKVSRVRTLELVFDT